ncbi:MAG TPA: four helix bundle protein [Candidatus Saccharimonadales bacterium]|nr:four helix bundle protein [Candidatus Saccharimonadales bacterium]
MRKKIETIPLYKMVIQVVDYADRVTADLPEEEKWGIGSKLRSRAFDATSDIAEAYGSIDPRDVKWSFGMSRRDLFSLKNSLKIAHQRDYVKVDPSVMVTIDKIIEEIDKEVELAGENIPKWFKEMEPPLKKGKK